MKHYKTWQTPVFSFFSTQFYRELGATGKGVGFVYLLALLAIACAVSPVKQFTGFQQNLFCHGQELVEQMPEVSIESGKLRIDRESPCYVSDPQTGEHFLAFDTSGQNASPSDLNTPLLVTADRIVASTSASPVSISEFKGIQQFKARPQDLLQWLFLASYLVPVASYLFWVPLAWAGHIIQALGFSLAGLVLARTISVEIKYEGILRIACVALGNVIILDTIMNIFPIDIPGCGLMEIAIPNWGLYKFVLAFGFTLFGVGANLSPPTFEPSVSGSDTLPPQR